MTVHARVADITMHTATLSVNDNSHNSCNSRYVYNFMLAHVIFHVRGTL
jgi:hypothetical protein